MLLKTTHKPEINHQWSAALTKRWNKDIVIRTFKPVKDRGLNGSPANQLLNQLYPKLSNRAKTPTTQALQCALLNLCVAADAREATGQLTGFTCNTTSQSHSSPKRYNENDFSQPTFAKVLKELTKHGLVSFVAGFKGKHHYGGLATLFYPTQRFLQHFKGAPISDMSVVWFKGEAELLLRKSDDAKLEDYEDSHSTLSIRSNVRETNNIRLMHHWTYTPIDDAETKRERRRESNIIVFANKQLSIHSRDLNCKRIFNGSFEAGGRFYANVQGLRKAERATIHVDGKPTMELDIKSLHPRLLYNLNGIGAPADCYLVEGYSRAVVKKVMLVILNAETEKSACMALRNEHGMPADDVKEIIRQLRIIHSPISKHFFNSSWKRLQYEDSCLTESVMLKALKYKIPVIPIHDSYIAQTRYGFKLMDIIKSCYRERYGFDCAVDFERADTK